MEAAKKMTALGPLKKYRFKVFLAPLLKIIECICELLVPFLVKAIIDNGLSENGSHYHDQNYIVYLCLAIFALALLGFSCTMVTQYVASKTTTDFSYDLKKNLYHQINRVSGQQLDSFGKNKALNLVNNDAFSLQNGVHMFMRLLVRAPFLVVGSVVASFLVNWIAGFIVLGSLLLCAIVIAVVVISTPKQYTKLQNELDKLSSSGDDAISGARVIRAFNKQEKENEDFQKESESYRKQALLLSRINACINPLTFAFVNLGIVAVLYLGQYGGPANQIITVGAIVALISYLTQSLTALIQFTRLVTSLSKAYASKKRIDAFLAIEPDIYDGALEVEPEIKKGETLYELKDASLSFGGEANVLDGISFKLAKGESLGIIGGTGSGKSTLLSLLLRYNDVTSGEVIYKGHNIKDSKLSSIRGDIAFVSQKPQLFKGTIRSNITLGNPNATEEEIEKALSDSLAKEFVSHYEDYIDHEVEENGANFSGGQKQRILICRALLSNRPLLILDDSTSALDYKSDLLVRRAIKAREGLTTILVSQRATSIKDCDDILVLDEGKLVGEGKHEELLARCPVYKEIYEAQVSQE